MALISRTIVELHIMPVQLISRSVTTQEAVLLISLIMQSVQSIKAVEPVRYANRAITDGLAQRIITLNRSVIFVLIAILLGVHIRFVTDAIMYVKRIMAVQTVIAVMKSATEVMNVVNAIIVSH